METTDQIINNHRWLEEELAEMQFIIHPTGQTDAFVGFNGEAKDYILTSPTFEQAQLEIENRLPKLRDEYLNEVMGI